MNLQKFARNSVGIIIKQNVEGIELWVNNKERFIVSTNLLSYEDSDIKLAEWVYIYHIDDISGYKISKVKDPELKQLPVITVNDRLISVLFISLILLIYNL